MRISDWSSDVCSSDLTVEMRSSFIRSTSRARVTSRATTTKVPPPPPTAVEQPSQRSPASVLICTSDGMPAVDQLSTSTGSPRSEEHTSELQSLMRISYAVFCLKKKNTQKNHED